VGEETTLRALETHPPDFVVLANRGDRPRQRPIDTLIRSNYAQIWNEGLSVSAMAAIRSRSR
jgi:hypothetical protein